MHLKCKTEGVLHLARSKGGTVSGKIPVICKSTKACQEKLLEILTTKSTLLKCDPCLVTVNCTVPYSTTDIFLMTVLRGPHQAVLGANTRLSALRRLQRCSP